MLDRLTADYPGQPREGDGTFGEGKMPGAQSEEEVRKYLSGDPQINRREMDKHIEGTPEYRKYLHNRTGKGLPPQGFFKAEDREKAESEIRDALRNGRYELKKRKDGSCRAVVRLETVQGTAYNGKVPVLTDRAEVSISLKKGFHSFPLFESGGKDDDK